MLKKIERKAKGRDRVEELYADIQIIDELGIDPFTWFGLHRWDKLALRYYLIMKNYYERKAIDDAKKKGSDSQDRQFLKKLPRLKGR